jgi:hypothetical protein
MGKLNDDKVCTFFDFLIDWRKTRLRIRWIQQQKQLIIQKNVKKNRPY